MRMFSQTVQKRQFELMQFVQSFEVFLCAA